MKNIEYIKLVEVYEKLEKTSSKLEKTKILANFFKEISEEELPKVVLLSEGIVFPKYLEIEFGVAEQLMIRAISKSTGFSQKELEELFREKGDLGLVAEECTKRKKQLTLLKRKLTITHVYEVFKKIALASGEKSQDKKLS